MKCTYEADCPEAAVRKDGDGVFYCNYHWRKYVEETRTDMDESAVISRLAYEYEHEPELREKAA